MRLKSAYRKPADSNSAETPAPSEKLHVELPDDATTVDAAIEPAPPADEATVALMRQLDSLQKGDELQKQYAMHQHAVQASQRQQPMTRAEFLRSQGLTPLEAQFFDSREDMMAPESPALAMSNMRDRSRSWLRLRPPGTMASGDDFPLGRHSCPLPARRGRLVSFPSVRAAELGAPDGR